MKRLLLLLAFAGLGACAPTASTTSSASAVARALTTEARREVARSPVPVLVPGDPALVARGKLMVEAKWYAFHAAGDGFTVAIQGNGAARSHPEIPPRRGDRPLRGGLGWVTRNEGIWSASWIERGAAYSLDLECADVRAPRCESEQALLALVDGLVFVGGRGSP